jgi:curved DNA-binding protein
MDDLFDQIFGRPDATHITPPFRAKRDDATHAEIELDIEDAFGGAQREITARLPYRDAAGRSRSRQRRLKVNIPAGVYDGKIIRLAGQGALRAAGETSDLLLEVHFRPHPKMRAVKRDIYMEVPLAPWEAALGAVLPVAIPTGSVKICIPKGVQQGSQLRVPGRGIPGRPPGDLILEAKIVLPPADSPRTARLARM